MAEVIRYLSDGEKDRTRPLWERIFAEDSERFLDYYYDVKTADNEILVLERDGEILAMLQLNPYRLQLGAAQVEAAYVIAVATDSRYRHQGMMTRLLERATQDRRAKGQPFLFLMPAAEAIYRPFGFRFIYRQQSMTGVLGALADAASEASVENLSSEDAGLPQKQDCRNGHVKSGEDNHIEKTAQQLKVEHSKKENVALFENGSFTWKLSPVVENELEDAAEFAENLLSRMHIQVRTIRDAHYYGVLQKECRAEDGDLCWLVRDGCRAGLAAYTCEEAVEIREPLLTEPEQLWEALSECFGGFHRPLYVYGMEAGSGSENWKQEPARPVIMARALDLSSLTAGIRAVCPVSLILELDDPILPDNTGRFLWQVSETDSRWERLSDARKAAGVGDAAIGADVVGATAAGADGRGCRNVDGNADFCGEKPPMLRVRVDEFVQLLFPGGDPAASAALLERMTPEVRDVWGKLSLYEHVFLNEIV